MRTKYLTTIVLLCLVSKIVNSQSITVTNAEASYTGVYKEIIHFEVRPDINWVELRLTMFNVSGPLNVSDFANEPSFISLAVEGACGPKDSINKTSLIIYLNARIIGGNASRGKLIADVIKEKFEKLFNISLNRFYLIVGAPGMKYEYLTEEPPTIEIFRELFRDYIPSQGFGKIFKSNIIENYASINFWLERNGDLLEWKVSSAVYFTNYFKKKVGQEYDISLRELTGYSETIQSSSECLTSSLNLLIKQVDEDYKLISLDTCPSDMERREIKYWGIIHFRFEKDITGGSVEDLSIRFKIVSPHYIDPTILAIIIGIGIFGGSVIGLILLARERVEFLKTL